MAEAIEVTTTEDNSRESDARVNTMMVALDAASNHKVRMSTCQILILNPSYSDVKESM